MKRLLASLMTLVIAAYPVYPQAVSSSMTLGTGATGTGGTPYVGTLTATFQTTYSVCGSGVAESYCWQAIPVQPPATLTTISPTADGDLWGTTSGNAVYYLANWATTWTHITSITAVKIQPLINGNAYALRGSGQIYKTTNAGSTWTQVFSPYPTAFRQLAVSPDDGIVLALGEAVGCGYRVYRYDLTNNVWISDTQMLTYVSAVSPNDVWGVCGPGGPNAYHYDGANWSQWTLDTGIGAAYIVAVQNNMSNPSLGGTLFAGTNDFWMRNEKDFNGYMTHLTGAPSFVAGVDENGIYGLFGATVKKFEAYTLQLTHNIAGQYNSDGCVPDAHHTCPPVYHTGPMHLQISGHAQQTYSFNVQMTDLVNTNLSDSLTPTEMYQCLIKGTGCPTASVDVSLQCVIIGLSFLAYAISVSVSDLKKAGAHMHACYERSRLNLDENQGRPEFCSPLGSGFECLQPVHPWCSNTDNPDLNASYVHEVAKTSNGADIEKAPGFTWENYAICIRFVPGPWSHLRGIELPNYDEPQLPPAPDCTVTP